MSKYTDLINPQNNVNNLATSINNGFLDGTFEANVTVDDEAIRGNIREHGVSRFLRGGDPVSGRLRAKDKIVNGLDDPSSLGFVFIIDQPFLNTGLFGNDNDDELSYTMVETDSNYSALTYLKNCITGELGGVIDRNALDENGNEILENNKNKTEKYMTIENKKQLFSKEYKSMSAFVNGFRTLTREYPYVFQTIEGLPDAYKKYFSNKTDAFLGGGDDNKIKIGCLESMDLRMLSLFDAYFNATYNHKYRRQILPPNLLKFNCGVLVHDLRNVVSGVWNENPVLNKDFAQFVSRNVSSVYFRFIDCIFDTEEIGESFSNVNNAEPNTTNFSFSFYYNNIEIYVNSLADAIESSTAIERNKRLDSNRVYDVEMARKNNKRKYFDGEDYNIYFNYNNGMNIGEALLRFGQNVFNSATSTSKFGNVYDESTTGLVSNILSTISGASSSSIIASLAHQGKDYLGEKIMENLPSGNFANTLGNMIGYPKTESYENVFGTEQHREPIRSFDENTIGNNRQKEPRKFFDEPVLSNPPSGPKTRTL